MKKPRIPVPLDRLESHFIDQIKFLKKSARDFDAGDRSEFRRMAGTLRVLLHDTRTSHALARQVRLTDSLFISFAHEVNERNLLTHLGLVMMRVTDQGDTYLPLLDAGPNRGVWKRFDDSWSQTVVVDASKERFTRKTLVISVANQDGGAHVDPEIDEAYHRLSNLNSAGWIVFRDEEERMLEGFVQTNIRQIAFEATLSLEASWAKILGNRGCNCGSGRKARYCCMKRASGACLHAPL
jgi:hypothetical protein